jgi:anti-sigma-K factor RsiG
VEPLPDLQPLSDDELVALLHTVEEEEETISRRRRVLHGRIDILRAERTNRLKAQVAAGQFEAPLPTSLERPIYEGTGDVPDEAEVTPLDLDALDDDALWAEIRRLEREEDDISLRRRFLHGQIDILRAERAKRARGFGGHVDPGDLGSILGGGG